MGELQLFGIDAAGETAHSETLSEADRDGLRAMAAERLSDWHVVEVWDGPVCLVRMRRTADGEA